MSSRGDGQASGFTKDGLEVLPLKPPFAHEAIARLERLDAHFGAAGQLEAVKGLVPAKCLEIAIIDLSGIPPPDNAMMRSMRMRPISMGGGAGGSAPPRTATQQREAQSHADALRDLREAQFTLVLQGMRAIAFPLRRPRHNGEEA